MICIISLTSITHTQIGAKHYTLLPLPLSFFPYSCLLTSLSLSQLLCLCLSPCQTHTLTHTQQTHTRTHTHTEPLPLIPNTHTQTQIMPMCLATFFFFCPKRFSCFCMLFFYVQQTYRQKIKTNQLLYLSEFFRIISCQADSFFSTSKVWKGIR